MNNAEVSFRLSEYEWQVLIGTSISGCNMSPDTVFGLPEAWNRLFSLGLIDRADGLALITKAGRKYLDEMLRHYAEITRLTAENQRLSTERDAALALSAGAYEVAAQVAEYLDPEEGQDTDRDRGYEQACADKGAAIRALTTADATAALERIIADRAQAALADLTGLIKWAHDTLIEINPSNYDHDEVCHLNDASVEVILGLAPVIGETHGKSPEWWAERKAAQGEPVAWLFEGKVFENERAAHHACMCEGLSEDRILPVHTHPAPSSSGVTVKPLIDAVQSHLRWMDAFLCKEDEVRSSTPRKVFQNSQDAAEELRAALAALTTTQSAEGQG